MSTTQKPRIVFIDAIRAYAILMMLQGHFIDTLLAPEYRDYSLSLYAFWAFFRGMTAPIFFFSSGLVFMYLLLKDERPLPENVRVRKGIRRGIMLIGLGYLLKWSLFNLIQFKAKPYYFTVDVLHCIGFSILALIGIYALHRLLQFSLRTILGVLAILIFTIDPLVKAYDWSAIMHPYLANYFSKANGSTFVLLPWLGYAFFGAVVGTWLHRSPRMAFAQWFPWALMTIGWILHLYSTHWMRALYELTDWYVFQELVRNNYLLIRLGHVLIAVAVVVWITRWWKNMPPLVTKIGSETLTIYAVHYIVLYGTWFNLGLATFWKRQLEPLPVALGALLFVVSFIVLIAYIEPIREMIYKKIPALAYYTFRVVRVKTIRFYLRVRRPVRKILLSEATE
ncbi:MAG TPA: heparan-alpha-glucosaminide N-acetyltransferase domain-containing protein [Saprospiraceae bacterium]|nr:heparan-alpha-glucosaminide N-acetyltransferase domain-containing protein [Saprospiraceae bacterium]HMP22979.1 heparan-alpha-glucosaminide N-acetyltransferase domain-containing protein [Saprospiraceae bacterium]